MHELESNKAVVRSKMELLTSVKRGLDLQDYLVAVRKEIAEERTRLHLQDLAERKDMYVMYCSSIG